jgi:hypothetical protein
MQVCSMQVCSMHFCTIKSFYENSRRKTGVTRVHRIPCDRHEMTHTRRPRCRFLPMAARQADWRSHSPYIDFSGYFVLANRGRSRDDRAAACVAGENREVQIVLSHSSLALDEEVCIRR